MELLVLIIFLPSLLGLAISIAPINKIKVAKAQYLGFLAFLIAAVFAIFYWFTTPYQRQEALLTAQLLLLPYIATGISASALHIGFRGQKIRWWVLLMGISMLTYPIWLVFNLAIEGYLGPILAAFTAVFTSVMFLVASIRLLLILSPHRKLFTLSIGLVFPIALFMALLIGNYEGQKFAPENIVREDANKIAIALFQYEANRNTFPATLSALEPDFLGTLPPAVTMQQTDWLYKSNGQTFTLGYWYGPDKFGSTVCLYHSSNPQWQCGKNNWGAFQPVSTPAPMHPP